MKSGSVFACVGGGEAGLAVVESSSSGAPFSSREHAHMVLEEKLYSHLGESFFLSPTRKNVFPLFMAIRSLKEKKVESHSHVRLFATPCSVAHPAPLPMGFSRQEYWSGLPFPSPGDLPDPGIEPRSPAL